MRSSIHPWVVGSIPAGPTFVFADQWTDYFIVKFLDYLKVVWFIQNANIRAKGQHLIIHGLKYFLILLDLAQYSA
jgi:hypothetical protein